MALLSSYKSLVVKVGSGLLVDYQTGTLRETWLQALADDIARLRQKGLDIIVVSSGAIALGRQVLGLPDGSLKLEESQAAASVGQIELAPAWEQALGAHQLKTGQILLTPQDTEERRRYLNARATIATLLKYGAVPIINENDTVATAEIRYGDNDRLAARVATMVGAECLVLLSDIDGLYDAPPGLNANAQHISLIEAITPEIEEMAGATRTAYGSGGMATKISAGKIAMAAGVSMVIASGLEKNPLTTLESGGKHTLFKGAGSPVTARKKWILGHLEPMGSLFLDKGAVKALSSGKSLLPAGVVKVEGSFSRGDAVLIKAGEGEEIGRGLVSYDVEDAIKIIGHRSADIERILGNPGRSTMIHRDDMVLGEPSRYNDDERK